MKTLFLSTICFVILLCSSCNKAKTLSSPTPINADSLIDSTLLPDSISYSDYQTNYWATFENNTNTNVNVLIENYSGHKCLNCPTANDVAFELETTNLGRIFSTSIHSGPAGSTVFQNTDGLLFSNDLTNLNGLSIATQITDNSFIGLPMGTINRKPFNNQLFQSNINWQSNSNSILNANNLEVNLQAKTNYFESTRGLFLHTEIDVLNAISDDLYQVVYLIEDSVISPQIMPSNLGFPNNIDELYVQRNIMRGCIDNNPMGIQLTDIYKVDKFGNVLTGDKFYVNYTYHLPNQYNPENMHLLIYVYNNATKEILQVIRKDI